MSVNPAGGEALQNSRLGSLSGDARFVAFNSLATNLLPPGVDTNGKQDVFVKDTLTGAIQRVSVSTAGVQADLDCVGAELSSNGRFVVFTSASTTLIASDPMHGDVFVHDRQTSTTFRVSTPSLGQPNAPSDRGAIDGNGVLVAFQSVASNLVAVDTNGFEDIFVRNVGMHTTKLISVDSVGTQGNGVSNSASISDDGMFVAFWSDATNLIASDTNGVSDIFVRDLALNETTRVSVGTGSPGTQGDGHCQPFTAISGNGRYVVFGSESTNLVGGDTNGATDVFVRDRQLATTTRVSVNSIGLQSNGGSTAGPISGSGQFVAFSSVATNLVPTDVNGKEDVFVRDVFFGWTALESVDTAGTQANDASSVHSMSSDGWAVAFSGPASNLVPTDFNNKDDVFVRVRACEPVISYCTSGTTTNGCLATMSAAGTPSVSATSGFTLTASNVEGQKSGLIFFGTNNSGFTPTPWGTGSTSYLCVKSPTQRTPSQVSGGNLGQCDGQLSIDLRAFLVSIGQTPGSGQQYFAQAWFRDPPAVKTTNLSDAVRWVFCP